MSDGIQFHLDENVDPAIADGLRRRGISATTTKDAGRVGATDEVQLAFAIQEMRVIVTHDDDFLRMARDNGNHWGIAYCHSQSRTVGQILSGLLLIHDCLDRNQMREHIEFL
jgi:predicted nuclease of predicted toxin-antitoxin system